MLSLVYIGCECQSVSSILDFVYKIAFLAYKVLQGSAPRYLEHFVRVADLPGRRALRSSSTSRLVVPTFKLSTVGSRAFEVSGPRIWKELSEDIVSVPSLATFRR